MARVWSGVGFCEIVVEGWGHRRRGFCHFDIWLCLDDGQLGLVGFGEHVVGRLGWLSSISKEMVRYDEALVEAL